MTDEEVGTDGKGFVRARLLAFSVVLWRVSVGRCWICSEGRNFSLTAGGSDESALRRTVGVSDLVWCQAGRDGLRW